MQETPKMLDVLAESLPVYGRTIRKNRRGVRFLIARLSMLCACLMANACSHARDKARQRHAESLAQLRASVEFQMPMCQPTDEEVAAVDGIVTRLGAGTIDGEALLDACNEKGLFTAGLTVELQNRLAGRAIAYRRLALNAISNRKDGLTACARTPSGRSSSSYEERVGNRICLWR